MRSMYKKQTIVVNFFSGPGAGKSTQAAFLFAKLKILGYNVELVTEYPKDKVWEESFKVLENQIYLFGKQHQRMWRCHDKVDIIITDSPLIQYLAYSDHMSLAFKKMVIEESNQYQNFNVFLKRNKKLEFQKVGRNHTLEQAKEIDQTVKDLIIHNGYTLHEFKVKKNTCKMIIKTMKENGLI